MLSSHHARPFSRNLFFPLCLSFLLKRSLRFGSIIYFFFVSTFGHDWSSKEVYLRIICIFTKSAASLLRSSSARFGKGHI